MQLLGNFSALIAFLFLSSPIYVPFLPQIHLIEQGFMRLVLDATQRAHLGSFCISPGLRSLYCSLSSKRTWLIPAIVHAILLIVRLGLASAACHHLKSGTPGARGWEVIH